MIFKSSMIMVLVLFLCGCATRGQKFAEMQSSLLNTIPEKGRIYIYRKNILAGAAVQPKVFINGEEVGQAVPNGFFYVDREPGDYEIMTTTEVKRKLSFTLERGQTRYVRLNISMGFFVGHVYPELVEREVGESEIQNCHYIGKEVLRH